MEEIKAETASVPAPDTAPIARTSKLATWSMVLGIISVCLFIVCIGYLTALPAIICGIVALVKISESKGLLLGKSRALAGIIMGGSTFVMIPMVAIIAAIAIPNLLTGRISANETSAIAGLKLMVSAEAVWCAQDVDGNNIRDYWTYDVSCFNRMYRSDGQTKVAFIAIDMARADARPAPLDQSTKTFGQMLPIEDWSNVTLAPKSGYWFQAMELDETGLPYNQNAVGNTEYKAARTARFGFVAYPDVYATSGVRTFIVNQEGTIYATDCGSDARKIVLKWPGLNTSAEIGPGGQRWAPAD